MTIPRSAIVLAVVTTTLVAACGGARPPSAAATSVHASPPPSPSSAGGRSTALPVGERAFADAWIAIVDVHDRQVMDVLIANPLSEYDLVGAQLIEAIERTRRELASLRPPERLREGLAALVGSMDVTLGQLRSIDPHGPRADQGRAYRQALDDWIDDVRPHAEAMRDALGLAPVPSGDLQL